MALEIGTRPAASQRTVVLVSELLELNFALFLDRCGEAKPGHRPPDWLAEFTRRHGDLHARLLAFWDDPGYSAFDEMMIVAHYTGTLFDETIGRFFERLPDALAQRIPVPPLPTETPDVPGIMARRLADLHDSPERREEYVSLLKETWEALKAIWQRDGRTVDREFARALRNAPRNLTELRKLLPGVTMLRREEYEPVIRQSLENDDLLIAPLWLAADGQVLLHLPGVLYIGVGTESGQKLERKREQAERVASRLKVLSDPTRVSMVMQMLHQASTITDLANYFELSQPTVSVHMKVLREAGLVEAEKAGNQTRYRVDLERVRSYLGAATEELVAPSP
jgi:ArsR family transcriptional regulator